MLFAYCNNKGSSMTLGNKLRSLRAVEGSLRGLGRPMTQQELAAAMKREVGRGLSQAYLSQIESGTRPHLTHSTRDAAGALLPRLSRFPGGRSGRLHARVAVRASRRRRKDRFLAVCRRGTVCRRSGSWSALLAIAEHEDSRQALLLLAEILRTPGLAERLGEVLHPGKHQGSGHPPPVR